mgnify:CR=1 FL=1
MYKKVLAYLALLLGIAEVVVILVSWLLTAAMPESFTHSLTSPRHPLVYGPFCRPSHLCMARMAGAHQHHHRGGKAE